MAIHFYTIKPRVWAGFGGQDGGALANMMKMSDLEVNSFSSSDEARNFVNLAENSQGSKG